MTHFKVTVSLWDYKVFSKLKIFESKGVSKLSQIKVQILQGLLKAFPHSDILRNDKTIFQYNFLYSLFLLIAFLNYLVLFPTFPPTHQLRVMTVKRSVM